LPSDRGGHQGIRGDEVNPVPALRVGLHPRRHPRSLRRLGFDVLLLPRDGRHPVRPPTPVLGVSRLLRGLRHPRGHLAAAHVVARRPCLRAHRRVHAPRGCAHEALGLRPRGANQWVWLVGGIGCVNIVYGALSAMAQTDLKYVIAYSSVSHMGVVMLGMATLTENGLNGSVFQMFAHGIMTGLFFALV